MEIQKIYYTIIVIIILVGCNNEDKSVERLTKKNSELREQAIGQQKLLDQWFVDFQSIQENINSISTDEILEVTEDDFNESPRVKTEKEKLLARVDLIKLRIEEKERQLNHMNNNFKGLKGVISGLKKSLYKKEKEIVNLKNENKKLVNLTEDQATEIEKQLSRITNQQQQISNQQQQLALKEIKTYRSLANELDMVVKNLPLKIRGLFTGKTKKEINELRYKLKESAQKYRNKVETLRREYDYKY